APNPPQDGEVAAAPAADGGGPRPDATSREDAQPSGSPPAATSREDASPLHHPAGGPPPRAGEDLGGLSLVLAIPDHPWTRATADAAAVRIAMTVAERGAHAGALCEVTHEAALDSDQPDIALAEVDGRINANLTVG